MDLNLISSDIYISFIFCNIWQLKFDDVKLCSCNSDDVQMATLGFPPLLDSGTERIDELPQQSHAAFDIPQLEG